MKTRRKHSALPIWIAAGFWAFWALCLPLYRWFHVLLCALFGLLLWFVFDRIFKGETVILPEPEPQNDLERFSADCRKARSEFDRLSAAIADPALSACCKRLAALTGQISDRIAEIPEKLPACHRFSSYILPTTLKLLDAYDRMDAEGISGKNIDGTTVSVENAAPTLQRIFERQLDTLYADEAVDISLDLTVLENLTKEGFIPADSGRKKQ